VIAVKLDGRQGGSMDGRRILSAGNWAEHCGTLCGSTSDMKDYLIDARGPQSSP